MLIVVREAKRRAGGARASGQGRAPPQASSSSAIVSSIGARQPPRPPSAHILPGSAEDGGAIAARASAALLAELGTYPKPGLVSLVDSGSHTDMDAGTFRRSVAAIAPFFARLAEAGAAGARLERLRAIGREAEAAMLTATGGVNTHRGAIFALGLLGAAAGAGAGDLAGFVRETWGEALSGERPAGGSHGARAMRRFGVGGARGEAAAGFPGAVRVGLPALREGRRLAAVIASEAKQPSGRRASIREEAAPRLLRLRLATTAETGGEQIEQAARVHAFFALLATLDDTNLLHRGGAEGLAFARTSAATFLRDGGIGRPDWRAHAAAVHRAFVARRLSPGGSADLLAATLFLDAAERAR